MTLSRSVFAIALSLPLLVNAAAVKPAAGSYKIDETHSHATYVVSHFGIGEHEGRFETLTGSFTVDAAGKGSAVKVEIPVASLDSGLDKRDEHLKNADFFDMVKYPSMRFEGRQVGNQLKGDFTLLGVTKPVSFKLTPIGAGKDAWNNYRAGYRASTTIKRSDFGMSKYLEGGAVGDKVVITVRVEGIKQP